MTTKTIHLSSITKLIEDWSTDRGLHKSDPKAQMLKVTEELGELAGGLARDNQDTIKDSIGDLYVTIVILAQQLDLDLLECIQGAYKEILDRKGEMRNGVFVKEEDLKND